MEPRRTSTVSNMSVDERIKKFADMEKRGSVLLDPNIEGLRLRSKRRFTVPSPDVTVSRSALTVSDKRSQYLYEKPHKPGMATRMKKTFAESTTCTKEKAKNILFSRVPIIDWLFLNYSFKTSLIGDIVSGLTVGVMHIPQGMGYAMLANIDPICGIYMAFFPVIIYTLFCTSMHCSVGSFAVITIMTGKIANKIATPREEIEALFGNETDELSILYNKTSPDIITNVEVASIVAFAVGVWKIIFGVLNLGSLCVYLSDMMVSGFMTGASFHVFTSQVPYLLGIKVSSYQGPLQLVYTYIEIFQKIPSANLITIAISVICLVILMLNYEVLQPIVRKHSVVPIPIGLILVVAGTLVSDYFNLKVDHHVKIVDNIPRGLPSARLPRFDLLSGIVGDSFILTIVAFMISYSLAILFAKRLDYNVDAKQELYALGIANIFGSFFPCAPLGASLSRSMVQFTAGGVTQAASFFSCILLLQVLIFIGPFFEPLPVCVLAAIIMVALKGLLMQVTDCTKMWKVSRAESLLWALTFGASVIIDIDYGLIIGIILSLLLMIARSQSPVVSKMGRVPSTDIYLDMERYHAAHSVPGFCILQIFGTLHFANLECLKNSVIKKSGLDPREMIIEMNLKKKEEEKIRKKGKLSTEEQEKVAGVSYSQTVMEDGKVISGEDCTITSSPDTEESKAANHNTCVRTEPKDVVVLDFGGVGSVDVSAAKNLVLIHKEYQDAGVTIAFSGITEPVLDTLRKCQALEALPQEHLFHSVHDAVLALAASEPEVDHENSSYF